MSIIFQLIYRFNSMPCNVLARSLLNFENHILKYIKSNVANDNQDTLEEGKLV